MDEYASQRPSGEKRDSNSEKGLFRKTVGVAGFHPEASSPSSGRIRMSQLV